MSDTAVAEASARRLEAEWEGQADRSIRTLLDRYEKVTANPRSMGYLRFLLRHYGSKPHPWTACFTADTQVDCPRDHDRFPDGVPISQLAPGDLVWSFNSDRYVFELKPVVWSSITRSKAQLAMLTLDDGSQIKATPDHRFMRRDGTWSDLQDLRPSDSLMPFYRDYLPMVRRDPRSLSWAPEHRLVADALWSDDDKQEGMHVHHRDARRCNTDPKNFALLTSSDHASEHHRTVRELLAASEVVRECRACGKRFEPSARCQYLCGECPGSAKKERQKAARAKLGLRIDVVGSLAECRNCGSEFKRSAPNHVYCSAECRTTMGKSERSCKTCGASLKGRGRNLYCEEHSPRSPTKQPMGQLRICSNCGSEFMPTIGVQRHCTANCRKQYGRRKWNATPEASLCYNHKVLSVVLLDERQDVWDIEVLDNHSFVVQGVVVHNCYKDNFKRFGPKAKGLCGVLKDIIRQNPNWRHGAPKGLHPGHPDVGTPGVAIAEADKGAANPPWAPWMLPWERAHGKLSLPDTETEEFADVRDVVWAALLDAAEQCDPCRVMLGLDSAPEPSAMFLSEYAGQS